MDLTLSAEQTAVRQLAAEFADRELLPHAAAWDRRESVDPAIVGTLGDLGFLGLTIAEADGGTPYRQADIDTDAFDDSEPPPLALAERAEVEREARRFGDSLGLAVDWDAVSRLDDEMLVNAIAQVAPFDIGAKQALLEEQTLAGRADLIVQLMQFQRLAPGGADMAQTLQ